MENNLTTNLFSEIACIIMFVGLLVNICMLTAPNCVAGSQIGKNQVRLKITVLNI